MATDGKEPYASYTGNPVSVPGLGEDSGKNSNHSVFSTRRFHGSKAVTTVRGVVRSQTLTEVT